MQLEIVKTFEFFFNDFETFNFLSNPTRTFSSSCLLFLSNKSFQMSIFKMHPRKHSSLFQTFSFNFQTQQTFQPYLSSILFHFGSICSFFDNKFVSNFMHENTQHDFVRFIPWFTSTIIMHQNTKTQVGTQKMQKLMHFLVSPQFFSLCIDLTPTFWLHPVLCPNTKFLPNTT